MSQPVTIERGMWRSLADEALTAAIAAAPDVDPADPASAPVYAALANACRLINGPQDERVQGWYDQVIALRYPAGGYGINKPFDAFSNGTVNPAATAYAITTADFVAKRLMGGFDDDLVSAADFNRICDTVRGWQCTTYTYPSPQGATALPDYSTTPTGGTTADHGMPHVWNCVAAMAGFLLNARFAVDRSTAEGQTRYDDMLAKGGAWKDACKWALNRPTNFAGWAYQWGAATRQDGPHNAVLADWLVPWLGVGPAVAQVNMLVVNPGDTNFGVAPAPGAWNSYHGGAVRLLKVIDPATGKPAVQPWQVDQLFGTALANAVANTNTAGWATVAEQAIQTHTAWTQ